MAPAAVIWFALYVCTFPSATCRDVGIYRKWEECLDAAKQESPKRIQIVGCGPWLPREDYTE